MQPDLLKGYTATQQLNINRVRLYLQVTTLSDMTDDKGICIQPHYLRGDRPTNFQASHYWPRQPHITTSQQRLWRRFLTANFIRYGTKWIDRIGNLKKQANINLNNPTEHPDLATYLKSLPGWYQRLLYIFRQVETDLAIWKEFRSKKKVTIVSDGGLAEGIGTFGWKLVGSKNQTLFAGAGPIDGPHEIGSSTRSELGGLAAPLFLVVALARFWGLKHKCRYRWIVDSKAAISQVKVTTRVSHQLRRAPDNSDYLMVIRSLRRELGKPIETIWVKGHQDNDTPYEALSTSAKHNVDVDSLATWYRDSLPQCTSSSKGTHCGGTILAHYPRHPIFNEGRRTHPISRQRLLYSSIYAIKKSLDRQDVDKSKHAGFVPLQKSTKTKGSTLDDKINSQSAPSG
jgi:hypothetical protein